MYICICNAITDKQIRKAAKAGVTDLPSLQKELGVATNCGSCSQDALNIVRETRSASMKRYAQPVLYRPVTA